MNKKKKRIFDILQIGVKNDKASRVFDYVLVVVIVTNIAVMVLETFDQLQEYFGVFRIIEIVCILFFTVEYVRRLNYTGHKGVHKHGIRVAFEFTF